MGGHQFCEDSWHHIWAAPVGAASGRGETEDGALVEVESVEATSGVRWKGSVRVRAAGWRRTCVVGDW